MRLSDFEAMVRRLADEVPADFLEGIAEIAVSPRSVPHPERAEIYTLGECIPLPSSDPASEGIQSRIVLYHGSFAALARLQPGFDWRVEAWETLTHELRHHLEWRARAPDLEAFDWAVEQNFARQDGEAFDPVFHLEGEPVAPGVFRVDDDVFLDRIVAGMREAGPEVRQHLAIAAASLMQAAAGVLNAASAEPHHHAGRPEGVQKIDLDDEGDWS